MVRVPQGKSKIMTIKLLVFDWDGTLSDSADRIVRAVHVGSDAARLPRCSAREIRDIIGLGLIESFRILYPRATDGGFQTFKKAYDSAYLNDDCTATLFDGARETLDELARHYKLAVATGKSRRGLDRELIETQLTEMFISTRCADETAAKPDPKMLHEIFEEAGFRAEEAIMIGDTDHDIGTARNAGVDCVAVTCGAQEESRLRAAEPAGVLATVNEFPRWLSERSA